MNGNFLITETLDRLKTEEDIAIRQRLIFELLNSLTTVIPHHMGEWTIGEIIQVGLHLGSASAFTIDENTHDAIYHLEQLHEYFTRKRAIDG